MLNRKKQNFLHREFAPGFRIDLHHKDMGIVTDAARTVGAALPVGSVVAYSWPHCAPRATAASTTPPCCAAWSACPACRSPADPDFRAVASASVLSRPTDAAARNPSPGPGGARTVRAAMNF